jgi:hypothetical protein
MLEAHSLSLARYTGPQRERLQDKEREKHRNIKENEGRKEDGGK